MNRVEMKQECERLMNALLPLAEKMLMQYGEFYPYGGYVAADGTITDIGGSILETDHPASRDLINLLRTSLRQIAIAKQCRAAAIIFDVTVPLPGCDAKSNAIQVCLDHVHGYSAEVFFPYAISRTGVLYGERFAQPGKHDLLNTR
jgi:hypothetical protein